MRFTLDQFNYFPTLPYKLSLLQLHLVHLKYRRVLRPPLLLRLPLLWTDSPPSVAGHKTDCCSPGSCAADDCSDDDEGGAPVAAGATDAPAAGDDYDDLQTMTVASRDDVVGTDANKSC